MLGAVALLAARHLTPADATGYHNRWAAVLSATSRCAAPVAPVDACPECRTDRACPADTWPHAVAVALTGAQRSLNPKTAGVRLGSTGRLAKQAIAQLAVAAQAAWREVTNLTERRAANADDLAALAYGLGLVEPRLVHRRARAVAGIGDPPTAIALLDTDLTHLPQHPRRTSGRRRAQPARPPHRRGHSAPTTRPLRRRFTTAEERAATATPAGCSPPAAQAATPPVARQERTSDNRPRAISPGTPGPNRDSGRSRRTPPHSRSR